MAEEANRHGGVPIDHQRQLPRLRRIEGQVRGLQQMLADKRYCLDVVHQIDAVAAALRRVQSDMVRDHLEALAHAIVEGDLSDEERRELADEVASLMVRLV